MSREDWRDLAFGVLWFAVFVLALWLAGRV